MNTTINLVSISSPIFINIFISSCFLLFYIIHPDTRGEITKIILGILIITGLSYAMTQSAFLLQSLSIILFLHFVLMILFQQFEIIPDWKLSIIGILITSSLSIFCFNLSYFIILLGFLSAAIISSFFWIRYHFLNKDEEKKKLIDLKFVILLLSIGFFFGFDNFMFIMLISLIVFITSFSVVYFFDMDNTSFNPTTIITISILIWFVLIHFLPEWNISRIFFI